MMRPGASTGKVKEYRGKNVVAPVVVLSNIHGNPTFELKRKLSLAKIVLYMKSELCGN